MGATIAILLGRAIEAAPLPGLGIPVGLFSRSWLHVCLGSPAAAIIGEFYLWLVPADGAFILERLLVDCMAIGGVAAITYEMKRRWLRWRKRK